MLKQIDLIQLNNMKFYTYGWYKISVGYGCHC